MSFQFSSFIHSRSLTHSHFYDYDDDDNTDDDEALTRKERTITRNSMREWVKKLIIIIIILN